MRVSLLITRYPSWAIPFAFLSMALFRIPLWLNKNISFWKLMGSGKNGSFDLVPDLRQWAILLVENSGPGIGNKELTSISFINNWIGFFKGKTTRYLLEPIEGHGFWDGRAVFGKLAKQTNYEGEIAVLTRATIRFSKLKSFWKNVPLISKKMDRATGLIKSYGIGEVPFSKQATFSIWESKEAMKIFAYNMQEHKEVVRKTHTENWYSEEMFVRFKVLDCTEM
ncbi:MAG: spheroidene monooxygenase [Bacteroidota bacterium]